MSFSCGDGAGWPPFDVVVKKGMKGYIEPKAHITPNSLPTSVNPSMALSRCDWSCAALS